MFSTKKRPNDISARGVVCHTDFHTHILPCIDDGSRSVDESLEMLDASCAQGVKRIVATPHFYSHKQNIDDFISKRDEAFEIMKNGIENKGASEIPAIYVGAEVSYFTGISRSESVRELCVSGTCLLLVEMPFDEWSNGVLEDLFSIKSNLEIIPIVAHIDRYLRIQPKDIIERLFDQDILIQANADGFINPATKKKMLKFIGDDKVDFLGSDCHDMQKRVPNLLPASQIISQKTSEQAIVKLNEFSDFIFDGIESKI